MIPETATHQWLDALSTPQVATWFGHAERLAYYRDSPGGWEVYSPRYGWRKSDNDQEWFDTETELGYFVPVEENT